jgi:hypothetical protein
MALAQYSLSNFGNSIAEYLTAALIQDGYLIYWRSIDSLQTADGVYPNWYANQTTIMADVDVAAEYAASRGIMSILDMDSAQPAVSTRPTSDGSVVDPEDVPVPSLTIAIQHLPNQGLVELGTKKQTRSVLLQLIGFARDLEEQNYLADLLRILFDDWTHVTLQDHDAGTKAPVSLVDVVNTRMLTHITPLGKDEQMYEIALSSELRYEA